MLNIKEQIDEVFEKQSFFDNNISIKDRLLYLKELSRLIKVHEAEIKQALFQDLRKHPTEAFITEIFPVLSEIKLFRKKLRIWLEPEQVSNNISFFASDARIQLEAKGRCLIISPWNYPFQLPILHLVACIAAGNTAILKPSEFTPNVNSVLVKIVQSVFAENHVHVIEGEVNVASYLLSKPFDHIHFTGSTKVGKVVMAAAAKNLSSCTLELGGKSPAIIDDLIDLKMVAQKLVFGKFINLGQTCIAPDYVLVPIQRKDEFIEAMKVALENAFGSEVQQNQNLSRIINSQNFERLVSMLESANAAGAQVVYGGTYEAQELYIAPTIITDIPEQEALLNEEIFGPLLPIVTYKNKGEAQQIISSKQKPLSMYLFTNQSKWIDYFNKNTSSGALVINDVMLHILHPNLPFGGVNHSGIGQSTGYFGLKDFSHEKPILKVNKLFSPTRFISFPYSKKIERLLNFLL